MESARRPPRPALSVLAQTTRFLKDPFALLSDCRQECGDIFALKILGMGEWVFLCSPPLVEEMLKAPDDYLSAGEFNHQFLAYLLGSDSMIAKDGTDHRLRRSLLSPFLNGKEATGHTSVSRRITEETIQSWPLREEFSLLPHTTMITLRLLVATITGIRDRQRLDKLVDLASEFFEEALKSRLMLMPQLQWDLGKWSPWGRILWLREQLRQALEVEIEARRRDCESPPQDILSALVMARDSSGEPFANETILDEIVNLVSAGQETSSRILAWAVRGILQNPQALNRIREEILETLGDRPIEPEDLPRLQFLGAVVDEAIRFQPLGPFIGARRTKKPFVIGGFVMPEGSIVAHCQAEISQREDLFQQPNGFHPENFYEQSFGSYDWCPFGGGARTCLGRGLALTHIKAVLATLFQHAELKLCQSDVKPVTGGFLLVPEDGLLVELEARH
ncbi:MAG: cytochrome P450 [Acidobacteriota bacterium]